MEFIHAPGVTSKQLYIYDGAKIDSNRYNGWNWENIRNDHSYGTESNPKIWVMREFVNSEANHLGMPLPKGRVRFYRHNDDGQIEFTGENMIDHTPARRNRPHLHGQRLRSHGRTPPHQLHGRDRKNTATETFEIKVRNHKKEPVEVRVVEHLYRGKNWELSSQIRRLPEERQSDHRVSSHDRARWGEGHYLYGALYLVSLRSIRAIEITRSERRISLR